MTDFRPIFLVIGILLATLGSAMMLPALFDFANGNNDWFVFAASSAVTLFVGVTLAFSNRGRTGNLGVREAFMLTTLSWLALTAFAALPFAWCELEMGYTDAFFESMSGLTTTGATVITDLELAPPGILLWRALLQWLGGIGIIVMAVAVLPMLQIGGMQLFRMESSDTSDKILPRATQIAGSISLLYLGVTLACIIAYYAAGMRLFDAVAHAMTTIATGGYSTHDASMGYFDSAAIDTVAVIFMIVGSLPFVLYLHMLAGNARPFLSDSQVRWFLVILSGLVAIAWVYQEVRGVHAGWEALRYGAFNIVSIMTGTGYATTDYGAWGAFSAMLFFSAMFIGGCAGSTSCGIKIFRFQVLFETVLLQLNRMRHPSGVFVPLYNGRPIPEAVSGAVMSFLFLFFLSFGVLSLALGLIGLDPITALSSAASAIANVGPGLGPIVGPAGTFAPLPDAAKWLLSAGMLLGRLELFTVLVLFTPAFWRG